MDITLNYVSLILNTIDSLNRRHYVFVIIEIEEDDRMPVTLFGYRAFSRILDFSDIDRQSLIKNMNLQISKDEIDRLVEQYKTDPVGKILVELKEKYN